jgi:putative hydrolase of the HAD superfamily
MSEDGVPRAILLDALGTLLALAPPAPRLRVELADRYGVSVSEPEAEQAIATEIAFYRRNLDRGRDPGSLNELRVLCAEALREAMPAAARLALPSAEVLVEALLASLHFDPYADARPALAAYRARGLRLYVVSNWDVSLHEVLGNVGLASMLDGILTSAEAGARKPARAIFEQALGLAGVVAGHAVHVGDSLEEDVAGARSAGIEPVLIRRDGRPGPPGVRTIVDLAHAVP